MDSSLHTPRDSSVARDTHSQALSPRKSSQPLGRRKRLVWGWSSCTYNRGYRGYGLLPTHSTCKRHTAKALAPGESSSQPLACRLSALSMAPAPAAPAGPQQVGQNSGLVPLRCAMELLMPASATCQRVVESVKLFKRWVTGPCDARHAHNVRSGLHTGRSRVGSPNSHVSPVVSGAAPLAAAGGAPHPAGRVDTPASHVASSWRELGV